MPVFTVSRLQTIASEILHAAGATANESDTVAHALVDANLEGHDSHGVVRVPEYVRRMEAKLIQVGAKLEVVKEGDAFAVLDGNWGWGQVIGRQTMQLAMEKASRVGAVAIAVCQSNHLGRIGDYPRMAAERGMAAVMFVNSHGGGKIVAPWGGRERRLSANPIAMAVPRRSAPPIVLDISTSTIAGGKVTVALNSKKAIPPGCVIDAGGRPSTNPADFFGPPEGALLPFGGHKGFALSLLVDILAGALSGAGCSRPTTSRAANSFLAFVIDIDKFRGCAAFDQDVDQLVDYVKSSQLAEGFSEILIPGEPERRERERRTKMGIPVDDETWRQIAQTAGRYGVPVPAAEGTGFKEGGEHVLP